MEQIDIIMKNLGLTKEQALELIESDKAIDRGEPMPFDLTEEQKKIAKSFTIVGSKKTVPKEEKKTTVYNFERKKKVNNDKVLLIDLLKNAVEPTVTNLKIVNNERLISFEYNDNSFEITLTQKRKPKN